MTNSNNGRFRVLSEMKYVAYYRVSTAKQGRSGLGLDAQKAGILSYCGSDLIGEFIEVESGGKTSRKELAKAIELCKKENAKLISFRLDRVLRNLEIVVALRINKVQFTALDCLNDSDMIINIKAALAEDELRKISERTKSALAQKKLRGFQLGKSDNFSDLGRKKGARAIQLKYQSNENTIRAKAYAITLRNQLASLRKIANVLNINGFKTATGKEFKSETVRNLLSEYK